MNQKTSTRGWAIGKPMVNHWFWSKGTWNRVWFLELEPEIEPEFIFKK
jgi:hypothetical protein